MKGLMIILICFTFLSGCQTKQAEEYVPAFTLSDEKQVIFEDVISDTLNGFYWYYDKDTMDYYNGVVPKNVEENQELFDASEESGYKLSNHSGQEAVIYEMDLIHFNNKKAGRAIFYFIKNELVGLYYLSDFAGEKAFGFETRNVFSKNAEFSYYESEDTYNTYGKSSAYNIPDGFCGEKEDNQGRKTYLAIEEDKIVVYKFLGFSFVKMKTISNFGESMYPVSAGFVSGDRIAVIVGETMNMEEDEQQHTVIAEKVVFFDESYSRTGYEFILPKSGYICVSSIGDNIILINQRDVEEYEMQGNELVLKKTYSTKVSATDFKIVDLDGNGIDEYIMTDGNDLYIFQLDKDNLKCIWRTNISSEFYIGSIYSGDLNKDGVKEIYISDYTGTTIRYTLSEKGMIVKNEDINYGEVFLVSDFDNDGIDEYILIEGIDTPVKTLFLGR